MQKKVLHTILSYVFLFVFLLPVGVQLEHTSHKHTTHRKSCKGHDVENHIHHSFDNSCLFLHKPVNQNLQLTHYDYQTTKSLFFSTDPIKIIGVAYKRYINYVNLRAPPQKSFS